MAHSGFVTAPTSPATRTSPRPVRASDKQSVGPVVSVTAPVPDVFTVDGDDAALSSPRKDQGQDSPQYSKTVDTRPALQGDGPAGRSSSPAAGSEPTYEGYQEAAAEAEDFKRETLLDYQTYHAQWQAWRDGYRSLLQQHLSGINPGFPSGWDRLWTQEQFDLQHLLRARQLVQQIDVAEEGLKEALVQCRKYGVAPLGRQISGFEETGSDQGYAQSVEVAMAASAPYHAIMRWYGGLYGDAREGDGAAAVSNYPSGEAPVEYPPDVGTSDGSEVQPGDSFSCAGGVERGKLAADGEPRAEHRPATGWPAVLLSGMQYFVVPRLLLNDSWHVEPRANDLGYSSEYVRIKQLYSQLHPSTNVPHVSVTVSRSKTCFICSNNGIG